MIPLRQICLSVIGKSVTEDRSYTFFLNDDEKPQENLAAWPNSFFLVIETVNAKGLRERKVFTEIHSTPIKPCGYHAANFTCVKPEGHDGLHSTHTRLL
jgi:hypothetical protein